MSDTLTAPTEQRTDADEVVHWLCCEDFSLALCGATDQVLDGIEPDCVVCDDLVRRNCCPLGFDCPGVTP